MKSTLIYVFPIVLLLASIASSREEGDMKSSNSPWRKLGPREKRVIVDKGTEAPFTGKYGEHFQAGVYHCKRCGAELFGSKDKFKSNCGWPAFDDAIEGAVRREMDADGFRVEILCNACGGHLGHVFEGEGLTEKNLRHCVNSISMVFVPYEQKANEKKAIFAAGCFWGVEYHLARQEGVISTTVGYTGGFLDNPSYDMSFMDSPLVEAETMI